MKEQMKKAGIEPAAEKLAIIAQECAALHKKNRKLAADLLWQKIGTDAQLLWEIFKDYRQDAARRILDKAYAGLYRDDTQASTAGKGSGHTDYEIQAADAASPSSSDAIVNLQDQDGHASEPARDHGNSETQKGPVPRRTAPIVSAAVKDVVHKSYLDTFLVMDYHRKHQIPIGDLNVVGILKKAETAGRFAYASARERELYLMIAAAATKQAHIPKDARVRDIFDSETVGTWVNIVSGTATHPDLSSFRDKYDRGTIHAN